VCPRPKGLSSFDGNCPKLSVAAKLTENDNCETVTSTHLQPAEEKTSEEKVDDNNDTAKPLINDEIPQSAEVSSVQHRSANFQKKKKNISNMNFC
jgi:hypothetical protein